MKPKQKKFIAFSTKIFWSIFLSCIVILLLSLVLASRLFTSWIKKEYENRYSALSTIVGESIQELETSAERTMLNAALLVRSLEEKKGILSNDELKAIAKRTQVTHIFIIDRQGKFIRSTNEDPSLIPNLFSFCTRYPHLLDEPDAMEATPILVPQPEPNPFKFLIIANAARNRFINIGLRVDFLAPALRRFQERDSNIDGIEIYSPLGHHLGSFDRSGVKMLGPSLRSVAQKDRELVETSKAMEFRQWTPSIHRECCQCTTSGDTRDGHHEYLIQFKVSKAHLAEARKTLWIVLLILGAISVALSFLLARLLSRRLVARLQNLNSQIKEKVVASEKLQSLAISGRDEVAELASSFNELMQSREQFEKNRVELERLQAKTSLELERSKRRNEMAKVAAQVSHDIRSPLNTLLTVIRNSSKISDVKKNSMIKYVVDRIEHITQDLRLGRAAKGTSAKPIVDVRDAIVSLAEEKRAVLSDHPTIEIETDVSRVDSSTAISVSMADLSRMLSNMIDNSIAALVRKNTAGSIRLSADVTQNGRCVEIVVDDNGIGMSVEVLNKVLTEGGSYGNPDGAGLGLSHARSVMTACGGKLDIKSTEGIGTEIVMRFPLSVSSNKAAQLQQTPHKPDLVLVDDDEMVRDNWQLEAELRGIELFCAADPESVSWATLSRDTPVYVDKNLGEGQSGIEWCQRLHEMGFTKIFLATAEINIEAPDYVFISGKGFPEIYDRRTGNANYPRR